MPDDVELLAEYVGRGSDEAFRSLVERPICDNFCQGSLLMKALRLSRTATVPTQFALSGTLSIAQLVPTTLPDDRFG